MRSGAAAGHEGYFHETAFYGSDDELLAIVVPFVTGGQEAGEPTLVTLGPGRAALVRGALGDLDGIAFIDARELYGNPARTIAAYRQRFTSLVAGGAEQIRVVGEVPHPGTGASWDTWVRYEAAVNHAYDDFPLWGMCPYDVRITPDEVLEDVRRTHPHVAHADGTHRENAAFVEPHVLASRLPPPPPDPLERRMPDLQRVDPTPSQARALVRAAGRTVLPARMVEALRVAVSEVVGNALRHGRPPVHLRVWSGADRVVVTVTDRGPGVADPLAGLVPRTAQAAPDDGGFGLWLAHQMTSDLHLCRDEHGFTVRLVARARPPLPALAT